MSVAQCHHTIVQSTITLPCSKVTYSVEAGTKIEVTLTEKPSNASTNVMVALYSKSFPCRMKRLSDRVRITNCTSIHKQLGVAVNLSKLHRAQHAML